MEKGKVVKWYKEEGEDVERGEILFEVETDKANVEVECYASGFLRKILLEPGIEVPVNTPIGVIADTMEEEISLPVAAEPSKVPPAEEARPVAPETTSPHAASSSQERKIIRISPLARRIAKEHSIDVESLEGTGPEGRITKEDVQRAITAQSERPSVPPKAEGPAEALPTKVVYEDIELTKMRKVIAERLSESKRTAPHFYIGLTADATALSQVKNDLEKKAEHLGAKVTFNDILIKLVSQVLREFPMVNASYLDDRIRIHKNINIGVAVGIDEGLVVPVVKDVDQKPISQISREVRELADKAHNKRLLPDEYSQGTFTITNLGMFGIEVFHAIINPPESAILAASSIMPRPVVIDGEITVRPCFNLSLSVDHRVVDGVMAAQFLGRLKELIECPYLLFA